MPSTLVHNASGGTNLFSGWWGSMFSGTKPEPYSVIRLRADTSAGGMIYVGLSGAGITVNSGGLTANLPNSSGLMDGMQMAPGEVYQIPKLGFAVSGFPQIYARSDPGNSGTARLYYEIY